MLTVIIPTLNAADNLSSCLRCFRDNSGNLVKEVIVVDGGSRDKTVEIAKEYGAKVFSCSGGRGKQLAYGASVAVQDWLLFIHSDTYLENGWEKSVINFISGDVTIGKIAAYFKLTFDNISVKSKVLEKLVAIRCFLFSLPYGDQGLLIPRKFYREMGGYAEIPLMEDVDIVRRIGRSKLSLLPVKVVTSSVRYDQHGYFNQALRNIFLLLGYFIGVSPKTLAKFYR